MQVRSFGVKTGGPDDEGDYSDQETELEEDRKKREPAKKGCPLHDPLSALDPFRFDPITGFLCQRPRQNTPVHRSSQVCPRLCRSVVWALRDCTCRHHCAECVYDSIYWIDKRKYFARKP